MAGRVVVAAKRSGLRPGAIIELTDAAAKQLKLLKETKGQTSPTVRLGLDKKGCNGSSYTLEFPNELKKFPADEVVEEKGITITIDHRALLSVIGTKVDYHTDDFSSEFVFINPNASGVCGCGESFTVNTPSEINAHNPTPSL